MSAYLIQVCESIDSGRSPWVRTSLRQSQRYILAYKNNRFRMKMLSSCKLDLAIIRTIPRIRNFRSDTPCLAIYNLKKEITKLF